MTRTMLGGWIKIITLPFKFFASELFEWQWEQLQMLSKIHKLVMILTVFVSGFLIVAGTLAQQFDRETELTIRNQASVMTRVQQIERNQDKIDTRIDANVVRLDHFQSQIHTINLQNAQIAMAVDGLTTNLVWGLRILGGMGLVLLGQFATYLFGLRMRREVDRLEDKSRLNSAK